MSEPEPNLAHHAADLLRAEYGHHAIRATAAMPPVSFKAPSEELSHQLTESAVEDFGIPFGAVADWSVWLTKVMAAIVAQNWLALFPLVIQLGSYVPQAWAFIQSLIKQIHPTPAPSTGPTITGS